jgi:hypothetical protein
MPDCYNRYPIQRTIVGDRAWVFFFFHFKLMQKFCFQYQFEGKGLWNNSGSSVKQSDKKNKMAAKIQDGCQFPAFFSHYAS